ncbi:hypothetical protein MPSEU_000148200 [Mayamaea pseudoterrestris]|nr:hypothetical protein MPSEU_000148200 [Mayamaea pseudoterrestris]
MLAEERIKKLARQPSNAICPNCGCEKKFGFSSVCMLSLAFVCNECKSSHQAISHRCKSLTMSAWTDAEVLQIVKANGNDGCRSTWLARAPPIGQGGRPRPGDDISVYKRFIEAAYARKIYYSEDNGSGVEEQSVQLRIHEEAQPRVVFASAPAFAAAAPAPVATADLLDFDAFSAPAPAAAATTDIWTAAPSSMAAGHDSFGDFASAPVAAPRAAMANDPFAAFSNGTIQAATSNNNGNNTFGFSDSANDMFGNFTSAPAVAPARKPIMQGNSGNASLISAMGGSQGPRMGMPMQPQQQQQYMMQMMGMTHPAYQQQQMMMNGNNSNINMMGMQQQPTMGGMNMMNMPMNANASLNMGMQQQPFMGGTNGMNGTSMMAQYGMGSGMQQHSLSSMPQQRNSHQPQQSAKPDSFANLF